MDVDLLDPVLLRSFIAVSETRSFTAAARNLGLRQSAVSQHVARLEGRLGRRLLARDTHGVSMTPDGDALVPFAREVMEAGARLERFVQGSDVRGRVRLGVSEDFASTALPEVLAEFGRSHRAVDLELTVALSGLLYASFDAGELDLALVKRRRGDARGQTVWAEELRWVGRAGLSFPAADPIPLVLYPPPSITRDLALAALRAAGRSWRVACTCGSLSALRAAALAGFGVAPHSSRLVPPGLVPVERNDDLPRLGDVEFVVLGGTAPGSAAHALAATILARAVSAFSESPMRLQADETALDSKLERIRRRRKRSSATRITRSSDLS